MTAIVFALGLTALVLGLASDRALALNPDLPSDSISYGYDGLGRLTTVVDPGAPSNGVARYHYDEVGNITSIERLNSASVSVVQIAPGQAPVGATVTIYGTGFSATPASNTVTFGGNVSGTVTGATETQLEVTVPAGAESGAVSVTAPGGSDTSDSSFTVAAAAQAPAISGFSPAIAVPGTSVTVSGTHFGSEADDVVVAIGQIRAKVTAATDTSITFEVPPVAVSGRLLVATPNGSDTSADDFFVPPPGNSAASITISDRMAVSDLDHALSFANSSQKALVVFDADAGQHVFLRIPSPSVTSTVRIFDPFGTELGLTGIGTGGGYIDTVELPTTGTYAIFVTPSSGSGTVKLSLYDATPLTGTIAADSQPHTITGLTTGVNATRTFTGSTGERVSILASTQASIVNLRLRDSIGNVLGSTIFGPGAGSSTGFIDTQTLPADGTYTIEVDPSGTSAGDVTLTLYDVPADSTGTITAGGSSVTVSNTVPGQNGTRTFSGTANERISLNVTNFSFGTGAACRAKVYIYNPDGSTLASNTCLLGNVFFDTLTLPSSGTYSIFVDPQESRTGSLDLTLYDVPADSTGTITAGGSSVTVSNTVPGQNGTRTFSGTANQRVSLNITNVNLGTGAACRVKVYIYKPDGSTLASNTCIITGAFIDTVTMPTSGTYSVFVDPQDARTGSVTLTLYDVPADDSGSMTIGGGSSTMTLSTPGQNGTRTFSGSSGQAITLTLSSVTIGSSTSGSSVSIKKPDGSNLVAPTSFGTSGKTINTTLSVTGTHTILIDPSGANTGNVTLALTSSGGGQRPMAAASGRGTQAASPEPPDRPEKANAASATKRDAGQRAAGGATGKFGGYRPGSVEQWLPESTEPSTWFSRRADSPFTDMPPLEARPGVTAISGQVLRLDGLPLRGVAVRTPGAKATTDRYGRFLLAGVREGHLVLTVDSSTANRRHAKYGIYEIGIEAKAGRTTVLPFTIWSPKLDVAHDIRLHYPLRHDVVVRSPYIPGLEVRIPAGSEIHDRKGHLVRHLGITPVPLDRSPFPMPGRFPVYFTIQPGAAYVWPHGFDIVYPNKMHAAPGARVEFYSYDPEQKGWFVYGKGTVTNDGRQIVFDPGTRQYEITSSGVCIGCLFFEGGFYFGWQSGGDPVDLATGTLSLPHTDLVESGTPQLDLSRIYRSNDSGDRAFGTGTSLTYDMALYQPAHDDFSWADLIFADGSKIRFTRISSGTGYSDAVLEAQTTPSPFYKARIRWNNGQFELTRTDGSVYIFGNGGLLLSIRDRFGNQTTLVRSNGVLGDITNVLSSSGRWLKFTSGTDGITSVEDQSGRSVSYAYSSGRLWKVTDANGGVTEYTYDASGRLESVEDPRNITFLTNHYDANGRVDEQTLADGSTYQFDYTLDGNGNVTQTDLTAPGGVQRRVTFNAAGHALSDTRALGTAREQETTYEYESGTNRLLAETDERGRRTEYDYNDAGKLTQITELAGTAAAVSTHFTYEPRFQQLTSVSDPLGHGPSFDYDARGALTSATDARGKETTIAPNIAGQPVTVTDPLSNETTYGYILGDRTSVEDPLGDKTALFYDSAGRLHHVTDALGETTTYGYDDAGALTSITDPVAGVTSLERDGNGNVTSVTDAKSHETAFTYDDVDRVATRTDPLLNSESFEYDGRGNLTKMTDRKGQVTTFAYDELDRLTFAGFGTTGPPETPSYESTIDYTYDNGNRLTEADDSDAGTITRTWDELDRLTSETTPEGSISYSYDDGDRRQTMTVDGQTEVAYGYDNADQLTSLTRGTLSVALSYDDASRLGSVTLPNGTLESYSYDAASRLSGITYEHGGSTIGELVYAYDPVGLRTAMGGSYARIDLPAAVGSTTYNAANQLTAWGSQSFSYDDNGNLTGDGTDTYDWNARDELASISGGQSASFAYDAFARRTSRTVASTQTLFLYDDANPVQELNGAGTPTANLVSGLGIDQLFGIVDGSGTHSLLTDALGSTFATADGSGTLEAEYTYEPFGKASQTGGGGSAYQFTGRENDGTGLQFTRARYYDPAHGRFISEDPIGFASGTANLYAYAGSSPTNFIDPLGLASYAGVLSGGGDVAGIAGRFTGWFGGGFYAGYTARKYFYSQYNGESGGDGPGGEGGGGGKNSGGDGGYNGSGNGPGRGPGSGPGRGPGDAAGPSQSSYWQSLKSWRGKTKTNGLSGKSRRYYEYDRTHNDVEVYDSRGRHLGSADPETGEIIKPPVPGRTIKVS